SYNNIMESTDGNDKITEKTFFKIKTLLKKKQYMTFKLMGDSMRPLIESNTLVTLKRVDDIHSLKIFDIVTFFDNRTQIIVCHYFFRQNIIDNNMNTRPLNPIDGQDIPFPPQFLLGKVDNFKINLLLKLKIVFKSFI
ncbi:MAG: hypothetical protein OXB84_01450, partial [Halobacteriovoraceae bacterium]|nr:hypothetical protein [Halobacteriovoraceae bacterium]